MPIVSSVACYSCQYAVYDVNEQYPTACLVRSEVGFECYCSDFLDINKMLKEEDI